MCDADVRERLDALEAENERLRERNKELESRVDDLEQRADGASAKRDDLQDQVWGIEDRVDAVERGAVDATDLVEGGADNRLEIQRKTQARKSGVHNLTQNEYRATFVWSEFMNRAVRESGKLKLQSPQVKNILRENDLDTNTNTVRRVMEMIERDTVLSDAPDDSLVTVEQGHNRNVLVGDREQFEAFIDELEGSLVQDEATDETDDVSTDVLDDLENASVVTSVEDDSIEAGEITLS